MRCDLSDRISSHSANLASTNWGSHLPRIRGGEVVPRPTRCYSALCRGSFLLTDIALRRLNIIYITFYERLFVSAEMRRHEGGGHWRENKKVSLQIQRVAFLLPADISFDCKELGALDTGYAYHEIFIRYLTLSTILKIPNKLVAPHRSTLMRGRTGPQLLPGVLRVCRTRCELSVSPPSLCIMWQWRLIFINYCIFMGAGPHDMHHLYK